EVRPDNKEVGYTYWPTGDLRTVSGARTYSVDYTYTSQGQSKTLTTHGAAGDAVTTWVYTLGRLTQKKYADGNGPSYSYTFGGRIKTRQWVRGITTTYGLNGAGE